MKDIAIDAQARDKAKKSQHRGQGQRGDRRRKSGPKEFFRSERDNILAAALQIPLASGQYIVFDIESTGGNPERNGITEICALRYSNGAVIDRFYSLVNPKVPIPGIVRRMTGITNQMVRNAPLIDEIMPKFTEFCGDAVLVSHNTVGDMKFLRYFSLQTTGIAQPNFYLCTHLLAEKLLKESKDKSLMGLVKFLGLHTGKEGHRADVDADLTLALFKVLLQRLAERGIGSIDQGIRYQGDFESALRLGWGINRSQLKSLLPAPGLIRIIDQEHKTSFLTSTQNGQRDVRRLQRYHFLPRPMLKAVLAAKEIEFEESNHLFAASLKEAEVLASTPQLLDPSIWHNKILQFVYTVKHGDKVQLRQGNLIAGATCIVGPIRGGKEIKPFLHELKDAFTAKQSQQGIELADDDAKFATALFEQRDFKHLMPWTLRFLSWLPRYRSQSERHRSLSSRLEKVVLPPELVPLQKLSGLFVVAEGKAWEWYVVQRAIPVSLGVTEVADAEDIQLNSAMRAKAIAVLQRDSSMNEQPLTAKEAHLINRVAWWITLGPRYYPVRFWNQAELSS